MNQDMTYFGSTHVGWKRKINEDTFAILDRDGDFPYAFIIADGMGGHQHGEIASKLAVDYCCERLSHLGSENDPEAMRELIMEIIQKANAKVYLASQEAPKYNGMGTTLTLAVVYEDSVYIGHVGDSRCYVLRDNRLEQLTTDHTVIQEMISAGTLTEAEGMKHPQRHYLLQALGYPEYLKPDYLHLDLRKGDKFLLSSDGLHGYVDNQAIEQTLLEATTPEQACEALIEQALHTGGHDNVSVITAFYAAS